MLATQSTQDPTDKLTRRKRLQTSWQPQQTISRLKIGKHVMKIQTITQDKRDFRPPVGGDEEHLKDVPKDRRHTTFVSTFKVGIRGLRS